MKSTLGFYVGYNYEIAKDGKTRQARSEDEETIGATGYNFNSIHICLDGNFDMEYPTWEQRLALKKLLGELVPKYQIKFENIIPHRRCVGANKSCFGSKLTDSYGRDIALEFYQEKISFLKQIIIHLKDLLARRKLGKMEEGRD